MFYFDIVILLLGGRARQLTVWF